MTPLILPIFLPNLGCRRRCLFCNQRPIENGLPSPSFVRNAIETSLQGLPPNKKIREKQVAFYGGSFTSIPQDNQLRYLKEIQPLLTSGLIDSIRISTRPDALDEQTLSLLKSYGVKTIEIGVQSMIDDVLLLARRGHGPSDVVDAVLRLKDKKFEVGLQLMIGLPGDTLERFLKTLDQVIELQPHFVRIHPTLVLKGAPLEEIWRAGEYLPLTMDETVKWLKRGILKLGKSSIPIARIGLQPTKQLERDYLAGPYHPALHQLIDSAIFFDMAVSLLESAKRDGYTLFFCHPKEVSNFRGQKNENIKNLKERFGLKEILICSNEEVPEGSLTLQSSGKESSIHRHSMDV